MERYERESEDRRFLKVALAAVTGTQGGPRTYAVCLLRALVGLAADDEYTLVSEERDAVPEIDGIERIHVPVPAKSVRPLVDATLLPWKMRRAGFDVFHGTKQTLPAGLKCARVVTVHDLAPAIFPETFPRGAGAYLRRSTAAAVRRADVVVADSETTARDLREMLDAPAERIRVIPLGVEPRFFGPHDPARIAAVRAKHGLPADYVASIGTIQPRKNLDVVLDAMELLAKRGRETPPLVVVGRTGWMSDEVVRRAKNAPRVIHLGEVPEDDLPSLYAGATLFVSPSSYEGFGLAVAEAMAAGVAVIGGAGSASDEVVGDAGVLVKPRDVETLVDAMAALLADDARRATLAAAGRARVARFTWEATARATREAYAAAMESRK
jgi:glycosyltransferase involved in cell wall biosynthesis